MSNKATIQVAYVNEPKSPTGPGNVKSTDGVYYKVWTKAKDGAATLSQFEPNKTYEVEFETGEYKGKPDHVIRKILSTSESVVTRATNGNGQAAPVATNDRSARIERQAAHKVAIAFLTLEFQATGQAVTLERLFQLTDAIAADVGNTELKPEQAAEPEVEL